MTLKHVRSVSDGRVYQLDGPLKKGGEALIYAVSGEPGILAKIYLPPKDAAAPQPAARAAKLACMIANPPRNPTEKQQHQSYAWPVTLIGNGKDHGVIGFLMPRANGREVFEFYNPAQRMSVCPHFDYRYLCQTARNIAGMMSELHSRGYVVGDVNQKNVLVSDTALVTVIDTDSFQIRDPQTGVLHLCHVRTGGFIAPEAVGLKDSERTVEQDLFGLGVLIFQLLMEGTHPFACRYRWAGEPLRYQEAIRAGHYAYGPPNADYGPGPLAPPLALLPDSIRDLFARCFVDGHRLPTARPTAKEWRKALTDAARELRECGRNPRHHYSAHLGDECPWCARAQLGFDPFPDKPIETPKTKRKPRRTPSAEEPQPLTTHDTRSAKPHSEGFFARHPVLVTVLVLLALLILLNLE